MPENREKNYFSSDLNDRERACFETGIKLGALYHILCGIPIASIEDTISSIEKGIEAAISCQPYVEVVKIQLDKQLIRGNKSEVYDYDEITGRIIRAMVKINYKNVEILAKVEWVKDLEYPLMYIEEIKEKK